MTDKVNGAQAMTDTDCGHLALIASGEGRGLCVLCQRAEIERLTIALAKQTEQHEYPCSPHCAGYLREQAARAEIERLQTLVKELADELDSYSRGFRVASLRHYQPDLDVVRRAREPKP